MFTENDGDQSKAAFEKFFDTFRFCPGCYDLKWQQLSKSVVPNRGGISPQGGILPS